MGSLRVCLGVLLSGHGSGSQHLLSRVRPEASWCKAEAQVVDSVQPRDSEERPARGGWGRASHEGGCWERSQPGALGTGFCCPLGVLAPLCPVCSCCLPGLTRVGGALHQKPERLLSPGSVRIARWHLPKAHLGLWGLCLEWGGAVREPPALPGTARHERGSWTISPLPAPATGTSSPTTSCWTSKVSLGCGRLAVGARAPPTGCPSSPRDTGCVFSPRRARTPDRLQHRHHHKGRGEGHRPGGDQAIHG